MWNLRTANLSNTAFHRRTEGESLRRRARLEGESVLVTGVRVVRLPLLITKCEFRKVIVDGSAASLLRKVLRKESGSIPVPSSIFADD